MGNDTGVNMNIPEVALPEAVDRPGVEEDDTIDAGVGGNVDTDGGTLVPDGGLDACLLGG